MEARFVIYPDLNTFLPPEWRGGEFIVAFESGQSLKHLIESVGIPHTEVGAARVNGAPAGLDYLVNGGDRVEVYPATAETAARPPELRFVLDNHLGRLAAYLRMMGFDVLYRNDYQDEALARDSEEQERILLTRDRRLLMRKAVKYGCCLRSLNSRRQLEEVVDRYNLLDAIRPFQRCLRCNTPLVPVDKAEIIDRLEPLTKKYFDEFHICPACGQIYWKGSHYERMRAIIDQVKKASALKAQNCGQ